MPFCLIDISVSQECLTDLWTILFLCWIWTGAWKKVLNKEKCIFWKKTQNCFNSKIFQSFSFSMKDFPQIILLISNYILKIVSQVFQVKGAPSNHSHKKRKDSLETRAEVAVICTNVENQAMLEPILLYQVSKCKQTKEQGRKDCLWTHIFTFLSDYCQLFFFFLSRCNQKKIKLCFNWLQFVKETQINTVYNTEWRANYVTRS